MNTTKPNLDNLMIKYSDVIKEEGLVDEFIAALRRAPINAPLTKITTDTLNLIEEEIEKNYPDFKLIPEHIKGGIMYSDTVQKLIYQEKEFLDALYKLRQELQPRWLSWEELNAKIDKIEKKITGVSVQSHLVRFLKDVFDKSKSVINTPDSPRIILFEELNMIAKEHDIKRIGGYFPEYFVNMDDKWVSLGPKTMSILKNSGFIK